MSTEDDNEPGYTLDDVYDEIVDRIFEEAKTSKTYASEAQVRVLVNNLSIPEHEAIWYTRRNAYLMIEQYVFEQQRQRAQEGKPLIPEAVVKKLRAEGTPDDK